MIFCNDKIICDNANDVSFVLSDLSDTYVFANITTVQRNYLFVAEKMLNNFFARKCHYFCTNIYLQFINTPRDEGTTSKFFEHTSSEKTKPHKLADYK